MSFLDALRKIAQMEESAFPVPKPPKAKPPRMTSPVGIDTTGDVQPTPNNLNSVLNTKKPQNAVLDVGALLPKLRSLS